MKSPRKVKKRPVSRPDPALCLAVLERRDRATVRRWEQILELAWHEIPPLRQVVEHVAVQLLSNNLPDRPPGDAKRLAAEALGLQDDDGYVTHPADRYAKSLSNWQLSAERKTFRPKKSDAA